MLYDKRWDDKVKAPAVKELEPWQRTIYKMIDVLNERGWCQHLLENSEGQVCIYGALNTVIGGSPAYCGEGQKWRKVSHAIHNHVGTDAAFWNNMKGRTKGQIINMLKEVAKG